MIPPSSSSSSAADVPVQWWDRRWLLVALVLASAVPLLWPQVPPLVDLPSHIGRYRVQIGLDSSEHLRRFFDFEWHLIANLGVDLLVVPLAPLIGLEPAVKLIVTSIPVLTVAGFLLVAREVHGRVPPTAFFALPLAYGYPFQFGFVNFALSMALGLLAFALWLRLARKGRLRLRAALFVPLACLIWICHIFGWALLGLLAFAAELAWARERDRASWIKTPFLAGLHCLPLALPFGLMLLWRSGEVAGITADWFNWGAKLFWLAAVLKERWVWWDKGSAVLLFALLVLVRSLRLRFRARLTLAAVLLALAFIGLPRILLGSAYADMRLAPYALGIALLALGPKPEASPQLLNRLAAAGLVFFAARLLVTTWTFADIDRAWRGQLEALDRVPAGSRVLVGVNATCSRDWWSNRMDHLGSLAIARRDAFTNDQWAMPGAQLLTVKYRDGAPFVTDPSQMIRRAECRAYREHLWPDFMRKLPRGAFDYLWLIDLPRANWPREPGLIPVWTGPRRGILYRFAGSATSASETPNGSAARPTR